MKPINKSLYRINENNNNNSSKNNKSAKSSSSSTNSINTNKIFDPSKLTSSISKKNTTVPVLSKLNINPFNINLNGHTYINNMKQFIIYAFISKENRDAIRLHKKYVNIFYKKINNDNIKLNLNKIINNKNTLDLINSDFYNLINEITIIDQFDKDMPRQTFTINNINIKYANMDSFNTEIKNIITPEVIQKILNNNTKTTISSLSNSSFSNSESNNNTKTTISSLSNSFSNSESNNNNNSSNNNKSAKSSYSSMNSINNNSSNNNKSAKSSYSSMNFINNNKQIDDFKNKLINIIKLICTQGVFGLFLEIIHSNQNDQKILPTGSRLFYDIKINNDQELIINLETLLIFINTEELLEDYKSKKKKTGNIKNNFEQTENKINISKKIKKIKMTYNITNNNIEIDINDISKHNALKFLYLKKPFNKLADQFIENIKNVPKKIISKTIPIKKNPVNISKYPEFLIISFNEAAQAFDFNDISTIIKKIYEEKPKFIFVCTQESAASGKEHFQHILGEILKNRNKTNKIELLIQKMLNENNKKTKKTTYNLLTKFDASQWTLMTGNKNVRTRIYYESSVVLNNIETPKLSPNARPIISNINKQNNKENMTNTENVSNEEQSLLNNTKKKINHYFIKNVEIKKSKQSGLGNLLKETIYKGSIFTKLNIIKNGVPFKMIIINSHLFYKKNKDTGLNVRKKEFTDIIKEFNLIKLWKEGYNIFFCGDLNFRLVSYDGNKSPSYDKISKNIINSYVNNNSLYKYNFTDKHKSANELYSYLNYLHISKNSNQNEKNFYLELLSSIETIGLHLTSKYFEGLNNKNIKFFTQRYNIMTENNLTNNNKKKLTNINKKEKITRRTKLGIIPENTTIFNIRPKKNDHPRIPSMTDRIIFCLADRNTKKKQYIPDINPANFNIFLTPDKSDHKMITLGFDIKLFLSINSNANTVKM